MYNKENWKDAIREISKEHKDAKPEDRTKTIIEGLKTVFPSSKKTAAYTEEEKQDILNCLYDSANIFKEGKIEYEQTYIEDMLYQIMTMVRPMKIKELGVLSIAKKEKFHEQETIKNILKIIGELLQIDNNTEEKTPRIKNIKTRKGILPREKNEEAGNNKGAFLDLIEYARKDNIITDAGAIDIRDLLDKKGEKEAYVLFKQKAYESLNKEASSLTKQDDDE